eukprot:scaffold67665_cov21-Tisochrysis_lutea.AAC.1
MSESETDHLAAPFAAVPPPPPRRPTIGTLGRRGLGRTQDYAMGYRLTCTAMGSPRKATHQPPPVPRAARANVATWRSLRSLLMEE